MMEDPADHRRLLDEDDQAQAAATRGTRQHVELEGALHQRRPPLATRSAPRGLRRVGLTSLRGGGLLQPRIAAFP